MEVLLSHGPGSNLLKHLEEVAADERDPYARIVFLCHDIGKATVPWQEYISKKTKDRPSHAAAGGLLAAAILNILNAGSIYVAAALHCNAAHHSFLSHLDAALLKDVASIAGDRQAREFLLCRENGIASLLPGVCTDEILNKAWDLFVELANSLSDARKGLVDLLGQMDSAMRLDAFLLARKWLGHLCFYDRLSARKQSRLQEGDIPAYGKIFGSKPFHKRPSRRLPSGGNRLFSLRSELREGFLRLVSNPRSESPFYFIDAPTGMGKTETMLQGAEMLLERFGLERIVYAVPQVSIADQIFEEYFGNAVSAQIWNYKRREKSYEKGCNPSDEESNVSDIFALQMESHPFSESYDVTTFNQVMLSMLHPDRVRCTRYRGLCNSVIIMDEFHKLPMKILPLFFSAAREFAKVENSIFIFGSATPFEQLEYWGIQEANSLNRAETSKLYSDEIVNNRREYVTLGNLTIDELIESIDERHEKRPTENLLVVVNLVALGSWPLRKHFCGGYNPWRDAGVTTGNGRKLFVLDGLTPPALRRDIVLICKEQMRQGGVTLVSTQMVEVGVDLDFDAALIDYQGLASIIQRGGRVGREGRKDESGHAKTYEVSVFSLIVKDGDTSFDRLLRAYTESSISREILNESTINRFTDEEKKFFKRWMATKSRFKDQDLTEKLRDIQKKVFRNKETSNLWEDFFQNEQIRSNLGLCFENAQFLADLGGADYGVDIVVLPDISNANHLVALYNKINYSKSSSDERKEFRKILSDYSVSLNPSLKDELMINSCFWTIISTPEPVSVYVIDSSII